MKVSTILTGVVMRQRCSTRHFIIARHGITLIELIVVLVIIMVLMAMSLPLIMITMQNVQEAQVAREIKLLDQACEQFKATFGRYPPGRIMLCEDMRGYHKAIALHLCQDRLNVDPMHQKALHDLACLSMEYLQSIFPGIDLRMGHDWNGDGVIDDRQYYLNGNEAMVFFLGGMRYGKGAVDSLGSNRTTGFGFSTDKTNPTKRTSGTRLGPFFEFDDLRLMYEVTSGAPPGTLGSPVGSAVEHDWTVGVSSGLVRVPGEEYIGCFSRYTDTWGTPYAVFSARHAGFDNYTYNHCAYCYKMGLGTSHMYNYHMWFSDVTWFKTPAHGALTKPGKTEGPRTNPEDNSRCSAWVSFVPYIESVTNGQSRFHNANRFQIISAGRDKQFGSGGLFLKDPPSAEKSPFKNYKYFVEENIPRTNEFAENYDNITNINFARVVPRH